MVLALGAIGAAFATGTDFFNVGALSSGKAELAQANTDDIGFLSADDGSGVDRVALSFDRDLTAGSTIWVTIDDEVHGWKVLDSALSKDDEVIIELDEVLEIDDIGQGAKKVTVAVAER
ncbi:MAG: hypothetical protein COT13_00745 [Chloroflexi bacterium CG08_land_8_20_14_0_20_45_12]|nr:MAG: hypothetical protein AUK00_04375 [Dehalococcoidia bacterium CG2_30_46_9]PIU23849.1 MAG: hypothetical protein COT13_00745 [Chloroflexi bacterium CG08_land_8_20_14_0_20_45_12]PIX27075.1 MAG: hypothetical protein COZ67_04145 [Chloroflexi bacterium CG_4_8_14_3_um_filter_45_15]